MVLYEIIDGHKFIVPNPTPQPGTTVQTPTGGVSTAFPEEYESVGSTPGSGTIQTPTGGVSTAFPEEYQQVSQVQQQTQQQKQEQQRQQFQLYLQQLKQQQEGQRTSTAFEKKTYEPTARGGIEKAKDILLKKAKEQELKTKLTPAKTVSKPLIALGTAGLSAAGTVAYFIEKPQRLVTEPVKFGYNLITKPKEVASEFLYSARNEPYTLAGELLGTAGVYKGVSVLARPIIEPVSKYVQNKFLVKELEGVSKQKGKVFGENVESIGEFKGQVKRQFQIPELIVEQTPGSVFIKRSGGTFSEMVKPPKPVEVKTTSSEIKLSQKGFKVGKEEVFPIEIQAEYKGTKSKFDIGIKGKAGKSEITGRGYGEVSGEKGSELFELVGKTDKEISIIKGLRGYKVKSGQEILKVSDVEAGTEKSIIPYKIESVSKSRSINPQKYVTEIGEFSELLESELQQKGKAAGSSDVGIANIEKTSKLKLKSDELVWVEVPQKKISVPKKFKVELETESPVQKEVFSKTGGSLTEIPVGKRQQLFKEILPEFMIKKEKVYPGQYLGLDFGLLPPEEIIIKPKVTPGESYLFQSGAAAKQYAQIISESIKPPGTKFGDLKLSFYSEQETPTAKINKINYRLVNEIKPELRSETKPEIKPLVKPMVKPELRSETKPEIKFEVKPELKQEIKPELKQEIKPELKQEIKQELKQELKPVQDQYFFDTPPQKTIKSLPPLSKPEEKQRYRVFVRREGVFRPIADTLDLSQAFLLGKTKVQETAAASFKIEPVGSPGQKLNFGSGLIKRNTFYESKREPGVFVQRREKRISSPGEKKEITFKGLFAQRSKKKNIFGGFL